MPPFFAYFRRPVRPAFVHFSSFSSWHALPTPFRWPCREPWKLLRLLLSCAGLTGWSVRGAGSWDFSVTLFDQTGSYILGSGSGLALFCSQCLACLRTRVPWNHGGRNDRRWSCLSEFYGNSSLPQRTIWLHYSLWDGQGWCRSPKFWSLWFSLLVVHTCRTARGRCSWLWTP